MITAQLDKLQVGNQKIDTLKNIWSGWRNNLIQASNLFLVCLLHTVVFKLKGIPDGGLIPIPVYVFADDVKTYL